MVEQNKRLLEQFLEVTKKHGLVPIGGKNYDWVYEFAEIVRAEEATNIINCVIDFKKVHPEWTIDDVIDLLRFREETRVAVKNQSGDFISLEEVRQSLKQGHKKEEQNAG